MSSALYVRPMIRFDMRSRVPGVIGLAVAGAQAGHLLAYGLRFGAAAGPIQASGPHLYFPAMVKATLGAAALAILAGLLIVGAARIVARGPQARAAGGSSFISLLAMLFTLQLSWFVAQEVTEALVAGVAPPGAAELLLWGMAGQLPAALAGAAVMVWLGRGVEAAINELGSVPRAEVS